MSQRKKLYNKLGNKITPTDITYQELLSLLIYVGFEEVYSKGDHVMFKHTKYTDIKIGLDSNSKRTIQSCYVKKAYDAISEVIDRGGVKL